MPVMSIPRPMRTCAHIAVIAAMFGARAVAAADEALNVVAVNDAGALKGEEGGGEEQYAFGTKDFYINAGAALGCVALAAMAAGMTLSIGSIDGLRLEVIMQASKYYKQHSDEVNEEAKTIMRESGYAEKLLPFILGPLRKSDGTRGHQWWWSHHLLLVTLLICNSAANECLPLFLDKIVPSWLAIVLSVSFVLIFGEVIPSALFTNPNTKLPLATHMRYLLSVFIVLAYPIAWPIGKLLDKVLGHEDEPYRKEELRALITMHGQSQGTSKWGGKVFMVPVPEDRQLAAQDEEAFRAYGGRTSHNVAAAPADAVKVTVTEKTGLLSDDVRPRATSAGPVGSQNPSRLSAVHDEKITRSEAIFAIAPAAALSAWLKSLALPDGVEWEIELEPRSKERRGQGRDQAWLNCKNADDAEQLVAAIKAAQEAPEKRFQGWIRVEAEAVEAEDSRYTALDAHEVHMINAVLDLDMKTVGEECRAISNVFMLDKDAKFDGDVVQQIKAKGFSRVPLFNQIAVNLAKDVPRGAPEGAFWAMGLCMDDALNVVDVSEAVTAVALRAQPRVLAVDGIDVATRAQFLEAVGEKGEVSVDIAERAVVTGLLFSKVLIGEPTDGTRTLSEMASIGMVSVRPDMALNQLLDLFQRSGSHLAVVTSNPAALEKAWETGDVAAIKANGAYSYGIITLEDVLEELVGDIEDEFDSNDAAGRAPPRTVASTRSAKQRFKSLSLAIKSGSAVAGAKGVQTPNHPRSAKLASMHAFDKDAKYSSKMGAANFYHSAFAPRSAPSHDF